MVSRYPKRRRRKTKAVIKWVDGQGPAPKQKRGLPDVRVTPHVPAGAPEPKTGDLFTTARVLFAHRRSAHDAYPELNDCFSLGAAPEATLAEGRLMFYAGSIRSEQQDRKGTRRFMVVRYVFVVPGNGTFQLEDMSFVKRVE